MPSSLQAASRLALPSVPADLATAPVAAWRESVAIDTYEPLPPDRYPMFLESRVYQGSSGKVYPLPFHDRIAREKHSRDWDAVHLENEWIRLTVLPELGGRIHIGYDKRAGYDFFYRNNVIKPALVGLAGPWISGGVEFNWPQHHRPATYLPVAVEIEKHEDGAVTVWCSDHDPFHRLKGMHGVTLHPDRAVVEVRVRLHNRTEDTRTFLWWANVAARVHDEYQSFFPEDAHVVADHARRATTGFPRATEPYYGIDYPARVTPENPEADRIDWYRNIPVPTSYMCLDSKGDFFGGYDHAAQAGFVHWADHRVSPGKKQWTWGNDRFGWAWDRNLTDGDGPYVELMAGVYTDNQPDFAFLAPGETKTFSQYWYPIQGIGPAHQATIEIAVHLDLPEPSEAVLAVAGTRVRNGVLVSLLGPDGQTLHTARADLAPGAPARLEAPLPEGLQRHDLTVLVTAGDEDLLRWRPAGPGLETPTRSAAFEPAAPAELTSVEELYLTGVHLAQYRHATRAPEPYWEEALRRDPGDSRSATALATRAYERGQYDVAEELLRRAITRLTALNSNPPDGEALYRLGLTLLRTGRDEEAYDEFGKAAWNQPWRAPAQLAMARLDARDGNWGRALELLDGVLRLDTDLLAARDLRVLALRRLGRSAQAEAQLRATLSLDPLDWWARDLAGDQLLADARTHLDVALEYSSAGFLEDALRVLEAAAQVASREAWTGALPLVHYHRAQVLDRLGRGAEAAQARQAASAADQTYCFPSGLDDEGVLRSTLTASPADGRAAALLGHWLYDSRRYTEAISLWRQAVETHPDDAVTWRNLAIASHNVLADPAAAAECFERAIAAAPQDGRLRFERDQLAKRTGEAPATRLERLDEHEDLVGGRDDLTIERVGLLIHAGLAQQAVDLMKGRDFQPWEGGEGQALGAWERAHLVLAKQALAKDEATLAERLLRAALDPPQNLGEGPHLLANRSDLLLSLGDALAAQARAQEARLIWREAATFSGDFQEMSTQPYSEKTYFSVLAWHRLGRPDRAGELLDGLRAYAKELASTRATIDYFATSLPTLLLFHDDLQARRETTALLLIAQADAAQGQVLADTGRLQTAVSGVRDVLSRDANHAAAHDLLRDLTELLILAEK